MKKIYTNIPISFKKDFLYIEPDFSDFSLENLSNLYYQMKNAKLLKEDKQISLCEIEFNTHWQDNKLSLRVRYSDNYDGDLVFQSEKLKYLTTIHDRIVSLQDEHIKIRSEIQNKYYSLISKIDIKDCCDTYVNAQSEYDHIQDQLKFEPGLKYIFTYSVKFQYGSRKMTDYHYINTLKMIKTTPAYIFIEVDNEGWDKPKEYRVKKSKVLSLLKNNDYTFEKHVERTKKLERLLLNIEETEKIC